jgi:rRNA processing protein Krr1/Pno1
MRHTHQGRYSQGGMTENEIMDDLRKNSGYDQEYIGDNCLKKNFTGDEEKIGKIESNRPKKRARKDSSLPGVSLFGKEGGKGIEEGKGIVTHKLQISADKVGQVLGSKGAVISRLQNRSGCHISINQDFPPGHPREVTLLGTPAQIEMANQLIQIVLNQGPAGVNMLDGPIVTEEVLCPQKIIGKVIGSGGHTIKEIELQCGVKIQINQDLPEGVDRQISVTGNPSAVRKAREMLQYVMTNGSLGPIAHSDTFLLPNPTPVSSLCPASIPLLPPQTVQVVECPKSCLGRIIGRGGETINQIQSRSLTKIHIEQEVPPGAPCRIHITGDLSAIALAIQALREVATGPPRHLSPASASSSTKPGIDSSLPVVSLFPDPSPLSSSCSSATPLPLPADWTEHLTDDGYAYWHNSRTSVSQVSHLFLFPHPCSHSPLLFSLCLSAVGEAD